MKIVSREGNLLDVTSGHIVHGCNAQGVMGSGVAKAIRDKWPDVYRQYRDIYEEQGLRLGETFPVTVTPSLCVWNSITQNLYGRTGGRFVSYDAIEVSFCNINQYLLENQDTLPREIHIPMIGAGLGGGNWEIIREIIEQTVVFPTTLWLLPTKSLDSLT